jgi:hypothetical protein
MREFRLLVLLALLPLAWIGGRELLPAYREVLGGAIVVVLGGLLAIAWLRRPHRAARGDQPR